MTPSPVQQALEGYRQLALELGPGGRLPSERKLSERWGVTQAAVNRAAQQMIASGVLRREGYKLAVAAATTPQPTIRIAALTHRRRRYTFLKPLAEQQNIEIEECYFAGRDSLRKELQNAIARRVDGIVLRLGDGSWEWEEEAARCAQARIALVVGDPAPGEFSMVAEDWAAAAALCVRKLAEVGHTEIAFLGSLRRLHRSEIAQQGYAMECRRLGLLTSELRAFSFSAHTHSSVVEAVQQMLHAEPAPTAGVLYDADHIPETMKALSDSTLHVPETFSLVAVGDDPAAIQGAPQITCAGFNMKILTRLILTEVTMLIEAARSPLPALPVARVKLEPEWRERGSLGALPKEKPLVTASEGHGVTLAAPWPANEAERKRAVQLRNQTPHQLVPAGGGKFVKLSMQRFANRSFHRNNGWLGQIPLLHMAPGEQIIHGVPYEILDEKTTEEKVVLILRSPVHATGKAGFAGPVVIPVRRRVRAVYFLHACGFVGEQIPFAWYDMTLESGRVITVPLIARGLRPMPAEGNSGVNIQDWWCDFPQICGQGFAHFVVTDPSGDPRFYERYLYTLEWENPQPEELLSSIRISLNPSQSTALAVLAITVLEV